MGPLVIGIAIALIIVFGSKLKGALNKVSGTPAKGILLHVSSTRTSAFGTGSTRVEFRTMRIDVEVPGQTPYEVRGSFQYPAFLARDMVPGATVELRVSRANKNSVTIVGPGVAFAAAQLNAGPSTPAAPQLPGQGASS